MKPLKNIIVGFLVSFIGSIPLGYLNIIGYEVYISSGMWSLVLYLLGVLIIEAIVIYATLIFAEKLASKNKLIKYIDLFSIIFMLFLAYMFYASSSDTATGDSGLAQYIIYPPFVIGLILSSFNFIQIPFWTSWNLYLVNGNFIIVNSYNKYVYVFGTISGTFVGMLSLVMFLNFIAGSAGDWTKYLMSHIIPLFFVGMAFFQGFKFWRKYYSTFNKN